MNKIRIKIKKKENNPFAIRFTDRHINILKCWTKQRKALWKKKHVLLKTISRCMLSKYFYHFPKETYIGMGALMTIRRQNSIESYAQKPHHFKWSLRSQRLLFTFIFFLCKAHSTKIWSECLWPSIILMRWRFIIGPFPCLQVNKNKEKKKEVYVFGCVTIMFRLCGFSSGTLFHLSNILLPIAPFLFTWPKKKFTYEFWSRIIDLYAQMKTILINGKLWRINSKFDFFLKKKLEFFVQNF